MSCTASSTSEGGGEGGSEAHPSSTAPSSRVVSSPRSLQGFVMGLGVVAFTAIKSEQSKSRPMQDSSGLSTVPYGDFFFVLTKMSWRSPLTSQYSR